MIKEKFLGFIMLIGSGLSYLIGGWNYATATLLTFMVIDYFTGFAL
jgi:phage-related holin